MEIFDLKQFERVLESIGTLLPFSLFLIFNDEILNLLPVIFIHLAV